MPISNVLHLHPRSATFEEAVDAFYSGRSALCVSLLRDHASSEAVLLRTRAHLRLRHLDRAFSELASFAPSSEQPAIAAEHRFLLATAFARSRAFDAALGAHADADGYALASGDSVVIAESAYYRALTLFMMDDFQGADDHAARSLDGRPGSAQARMLELRSLIASIRCDPTTTVRMLRAALLRLDPLPRRDLYLESNMINNLLIPITETNVEWLPASLRERAESFPWNDELGELHYDVVYHLAWLEALAGNHLAAYRFFRIAISVAPSLARRSQAFVDRSYLSREMGEPLSAADSLSDAEDLVAMVDWPATCDDERLALLELASLLARTAPSRASALVSLYRSLPPIADSLNAAAHGHPLPRSREHHAFGLVALSDLGPSFALSHLREAYRLYCLVGSRWRSAVVAMDIYDIDGDSGMLAFAREQARRIPHSWLARRVAAASQP